MKRVLLAAIVASLAISAMFSIADMRVALAQESPTLDQMTEEQRIAELEAMQWIVGPGTHTLPLSHSQIELSQGQELLLGETAARYDYLTGGIETPETEAIVWNAADGALTYFSFYDIGYVTEEDWDRVDPVEFMTQIKEAGIQANVERERVGIDPFYISDWRQEPTYDAATHTAYWATDVTDIMTQWVNAVAIRLSRTGYQQVIWAGGGDAALRRGLSLRGFHRRRRALGHEHRRTRRSDHGRRIRRRHYRRDSRCGLSVHEKGRRLAGCRGRCGCCRRRAPQTACGRQCAVDGIAADRIERSAAALVTTTDILATPAAFAHAPAFATGALIAAAGRLATAHTRPGGSFGAVLAMARSRPDS
jgi:hypothetical protein